MTVEHRNVVSESL